MSTIPVSLTQEQFEQYIRPALSVAQRGCECRIPLYKVFNDLLYRLHTGCQWECLPIAPHPSDPSKKKSAIMLSTITSVSEAEASDIIARSSTVPVNIH